MLSVAPFTLFAIAERQDEITQRSTTAECKQLNHNLYFRTPVASKKGVFTNVVDSRVLHIFVIHVVQPRWSSLSLYVPAGSNDFCIRGHLFVEDSKS